MRTMHSTLLVGPADWDRARMPLAEFEGRVDALWKRSGAVGAIVYGDAANHGALAYLTNFTPKLEPALAFMSRAGAPTLLVGGGVNMIGAARPLTWVEDLRPMREPNKAAADWVRTLPQAARVLLIGGDLMPFPIRSALDAALAAECAVEDGSETLQAQMHQKGPRELAAIRGACDRLRRAVVAFRSAHAAGAGMTNALLAAEHDAQRGGAQDVRSLFSLDGGRTLRPFDAPIQSHADPLQAYIAVRHAGYWAEGFVRAAHRPDLIGARANEILRAMMAAAKPGQSCRALAQIVTDAGSVPHPMTGSVFGNGIGLSLEEPQLLTATGAAMLAPGSVCSLRAGVLDGEGAIASAMLHITDSGNEVLWSSSGDA